MVRARLHIICGNCGCGDDFEFTVHDKVVSASEVVEEQSVSLSCKNCGTIHNIADNAKLRSD